MHVQRHFANYYEMASILAAALLFRFHVYSGMYHFLYVFAIVFSDILSFVHSKSKSTTPLQRTYTQQICESLMKQFPNAPIDVSCFFLLFYSYHPI